MALIDIIKQRKSTRKYLDKPIAREDIIKCIEAARLSPSADNIQPWRFIVIDDAEYKKKFCAEVLTGIFRRTRFIEKAAVIVVLVAKTHLIVHRIGKRVVKTDVQLLDMGISGEHIVLQAQELGIGTCWINMFNPKRAKKFLNLSSNYRVISLIAMGYPAEGGTKDRRDLSLEDIMFFNKDSRHRL
ncbi:MAG: nitroreductase family protein [Spirochaetota bacterium]|nr:MAG: nitroreductase family protein [Spirochaetota bacterium]